MLKNLADKASSGPDAVFSHPDPFILHVNAQSYRPSDEPTVHTPRFPGPQAPRSPASDMTDGFLYEDRGGESSSYEDWGDEEPQVQNAVAAVEGRRHASSAAADSFYSTPSTCGKHTAHSISDEEPSEPMPLETSGLALYRPPPPWSKLHSFLLSPAIERTAHRDKRARTSGGELSLKQRATAKERLVTSRSRPVLVVSEFEKQKTARDNLTRAKTNPFASKETPRRPKRDPFEDAREMIKTFTPQGSSGHSLSNTSTPYSSKRESALSRPSSSLRRNGSGSRTSASAPLVTSNSSSASLKKSAAGLSASPVDKTVNDASMSATHTTPPHSSEASDARSSTSAKKFHSTEDGLRNPHDTRPLYPISSLPIPIFPPEAIAAAKREERRQARLEERRTRKTRPEPVQLKLTAFTSGARDRNKGKAKQTSPVATSSESSADRSGKPKERIQPTVSTVRTPLNFDATPAGRSRSRSCSAPVK